MVLSFFGAAVVRGPTNVFVDERGSGRWHGERLAVEAVREDRLHAAIAGGAHGPRALTGLLKPRGVVAPGEAQEAEAGAEALLGMRAPREDMTHDRRGRRPDRLGPEEEARRGPLRVAPVGVRPMRRLRREAVADVAPAMGGDAAAVAEDLDHRRGGADVDALADQRVGDTVVVMVELDVVVDVDADVGLPRGDVEAARRQWPQRGTIEILPERAARAVELRERPIVEPVEPRADRLVRLAEAEEALVAERGEHPALDLLDRVLDFRLVAWPPHAGRDDRGAVVRGELAIGRIDFGLVAAGRRDASLVIVGRGDRGAT